MFKYAMIILLASASTKSCNNKAKNTEVETETTISEIQNEEMEQKSTEIEKVHDIYALTSIAGQEINKSLFPSGIPNLEINITENKIIGFSGCNNFFGSIDSLSENTIKLGPIAATKKYCQGVDENTFFEKLNQVNTYKREALQLLLYNKDELLMTFKKVD